MKKMTIVLLVVVVCIGIIGLVIVTGDNNFQDTNNDLVKVDNIDRVSSALDVKIDDSFIFATNSKPVGLVDTLSDEGDIIISGDISSITSLKSGQSADVINADVAYKISNDQIEFASKSNTYYELQVSSPSNITITVK